MDVDFCLCTVIFIFYMDHASLVFRICMCTLIVFLLFCNVFNWRCRVSNTSHIFSSTDFLSWHRFNYDVHTCRSMTGYKYASAPYLRQRVFIIPYTVFFIIVFSAFHSIRSRVSHPYVRMVPPFPVSRFPPLHFWRCRVSCSRIFSRPD